MQDRVEQLSGGRGGRALRDGDLLGVGRAENLAGPLDVAPLLPTLSESWTLRVLPGPHGAPDYLSAAGVDAFFTLPPDNSFERLMGRLRRSLGEAARGPTSLPARRTKPVRSRLPES